jgi:hypothetical protein
MVKRKISVTVKREANGQYGTYVSGGIHSYHFKKKTAKETAERIRRAIRAGRGIPQY